MMRLFFLCGLFAMSMAQAEVLPENVIQQVAAKVHAGCVKADTKASGWKPDELASICGCAQTTMATKLRTTQFSNLSKPSPADIELLQSTESKSTKECVRTQQESQVITLGIPQCMAGAKTNSKLKGLNKENQEALCTCAAKRTAHYADFDKLSHMNKFDRQARVNAEWVVSINECAKK